MLSLLFIVSCNGPDSLQKKVEGKFLLLDSEKSGVDFTNNIVESDLLNYFTYEYIYNGGGVAIADFNNDGLSDLYFVSNQGSDIMYKNRGNLQFEKLADLEKSKDGWHTGVTIADVNNDGLLDIFICRSGLANLVKDRSNLLYINKGDFNFEESSHEYGLSDSLPSTQASFFDFDNDGDLDLYVVNIPDEFSSQNTVGDIRKKFESGTNHSDKLYKNDNGTFVDVSLEVGINNHAFGLGLATVDINGDGFVDVYVSNDYDDRDYMFYNDGKGRLFEVIRNTTKHISQFSMGVDVADFNNDMHNDIMVVDMAYSDHYKSKTNMASMSTAKFNGIVRRGEHRQYMQNTLQLNSGLGTFSEIAQLGGVAKTDWSWAPLFADFDNDGWKDLLITNGFPKNVQNRDFQNTLNKEIKQRGKLAYSEVEDMVSSSSVGNRVYQNKGELSFEERVVTWGLDAEINTNGAAYGDLDNDGDLDLVFNNINGTASIYENRISSKNFLQIEISDKLPMLGSRCDIWIGDQCQTQQLTPTRGYLSSVEPIFHFGLDTAQVVDKVVIKWTDGVQQEFKDVAVNQRFVISERLDTKESNARKIEKQFHFEEVAEDLGVDFVHKENTFDDYKSQLLLPHSQSKWGPYASVADVNGDGIDDFFIGGAQGQAGILYTQNKEGKFSPLEQLSFIRDKDFEDLESIFFDIDQDGDMDLYVVSGGADESTNKYQDRLYLNDGHGSFTNDTEKRLPKINSSALAVSGGDFDDDGDVDLIVGGRVIPNQYPYAPESYLLENRDGKLVNVTREIAPELERVGMVTDANFTDFDKDGDLDIAITGELMPIIVFENTEGSFVKTELLKDSEGFWFCMQPDDIDLDGDIDFVMGNLGLNKKFKAKDGKPFNVFCNDFDGNGTYDVVLSSYQKGKHYPIRGRECSSQQMPFVSEKFPTYSAFAAAEIEEILPSEKLASAIHQKVFKFSSGILENINGQYRLKKFPEEAQVSILNRVCIVDLDDDGKKDVLAVGNLYDTEVETVPYDASFGYCLLQNQENNFSHEPSYLSGVHLTGNHKGIIPINVLNRSKCFIVTNTAGRAEILIANQ